MNTLLWVGIGAAAAVPLCMILWILWVGARGTPPDYSKPKPRSAVSQGEIAWYDRTVAAADVGARDGGVLGDLRYVHEYEHAEDAWKQAEQRRSWRRRWLPWERAQAWYQRRRYGGDLHYWKAEAQAKTLELREWQARTVAVNDELHSERRANWQLRADLGLPVPAHAWPRPSSSAEDWKSRAESLVAELHSERKANLLLRDELVKLAAASGPGTS